VHGGAFVLVTESVSSPEIIGSNMRSIDLRQDWPQIRKGLEQIQAKSTDLDWIPEDFYMLLKQRVMDGYVLDGVGFALFRDVTNPYTQARGVFVMAVHGLRRADTMRAWKEFEQQAQGCGYEFIEMDSTRSGWERHSDWRPVRTVYRKEL
jgi:hypothetical protein